MMPSQLDAMLAESGFDPEESGDLVTLLAPLQDTVAAEPVPSAALLVLFGEAAPRTSYDGPVPWATWPGIAARRALVGAVVLAISGVGATGLSAVANTLPEPWQRGVSDFSHHYLPFDLPQPPQHRARHSLVRLGGGKAHRLADASGRRAGAAVAGGQEVGAVEKSQVGLQAATTDTGDAPASHPRTGDSGAATKPISPKPAPAVPTPGAAPSPSAPPAPTVQQPAAAPSVKPVAASGDKHVQQPDPVRAPHNLASDWRPPLKHLERPDHDGKKGEPEDPDDRRDLGAVADEPGNVGPGDDGRPGDDQGDDQDDPGKYDGASWDAPPDPGDAPSWPKG